MKTILNIVMLLLVIFGAGCYSCESFHSFWGKGPVEPGCEELLFFDKDCQPVAPPAPKPQPAPVAKPKPAPPKPKAVGECGEYEVSRGYPSSGSAVVRLDKIMPKEVQLNAPFTYSMKVTNVSEHLVGDVVVTENIPGGFTFSSASPQAGTLDGKLVWRLGSIDAKASKSISVTGRATGTDCLKYCATVTYVIPTCASVKVVQAQLKLEKTAPSAVLLCEPIPVTFRVTNGGTGSASNVQIVDTLPAGLKTSDGKTRLAFNAGTLGPGQSKQFKATLKASKTGRYVNRASASSGSGLKAEATTTTVVRQPILAITKTGPERQYLGRAVAYKITVKNNGDAAATDTVLEDILPSGIESVKATSGGRLSGSKVVWQLGTIAPKSDKTVSVSYTPTAAGTLRNTATVKATCAESVRASASTSLAGIPAILLEVIDIDDPVEIGGSTTYVIIATNQGSAPGTNIKIVCTLEDNEQYVSSSGATNGTARQGTITFAPLRTLAPKEKATWRVVVKAVKAGDVRFKVSMTTDELGRPVEETEATHLYQ